MIDRDDLPAGLTRRAEIFIGVHGNRFATPDVGLHRAQWLQHGVPAPQVDRVLAWTQRWGGVVLPPSVHYDGGPRMLAPDGLERSGESWLFEAGAQRTALPYSFMIGPKGEFGIHADRWVPLHAGVEGWVESLALAEHAFHSSRATATVTGGAVEALDLEGFEPVAEVAGLADTWWRGPDSLVAVYRGEAECLSAPQCRTATVYSKFAWGLA